MTRLLGVLLLVSCVQIDPYRCDDDAQCTAAAGGRCEADGYCSHTDASCPSGRRYGELAGPQRGRCVDDDPGTTTGSGESSAPSTSPPSTESTGPGSSSSSSTGCDAECPTPAGAAIWEQAIVGPAGTTDRLNALVHLPGGDIVGVGSEETTTQDALLVRVTNDGVLDVHVTYDVQGGDDEALAVVLDAEGDVWVCGRGDGASLQAWIASFLPSLPAMPQDSVSLDHQTCRVLDIVDSGTWIAAGDDADLGAGAWTYTFAPWDMHTGSITAVPGQAGDRIEASAPLGGDVLLGGGMADLPAIARVVDDTWGPPLYVGEAPGRVQALVSHDGWFVAGGFVETPNQADPWVSARELDGGERWSWTLDPASPLGDEIESVAIDAEGNVFAVGFTGPRRLAIAFTPDGIVRWTTTWEPSGQGREIVRDVIVLPEGDPIVAGEILGDDGSLDGWIARLAR